MKMASTRVSSLLNRFKFEQKPQKQMKMNGFSPSARNIPDAVITGKASQVNAGETTGSGLEPARSRLRPSTPELCNGDLCVPDTPTSELPECIDSGSPVFPSCSAKKKVAESSQRSLVSSTISSLLSPTRGGSKSPTFGKSDHLTNGHVAEGCSHVASRSKKKRREMLSTESDDDLDSQPSSLSENGQRGAELSPKFSGRKARSIRGSESDSTHITSAETQDSQETVSYSYGDESESSQRCKGAGGAKRKLSELSWSEGEDIRERDLSKERRDALEQLRICFPKIASKELIRALSRTDWNINHAANEIMQAREGNSPQRKQHRSEESKAPHVKSVSTTPVKYQDAFSGWLKKPSVTTVIPGQEVSSSKELKPSATHDNGQKNSSTVKQKQRSIVSSSSDSDDIVERDSDGVRSERRQGKKAFRRIRTFSSDSHEEISPVKACESMERDDRLAGNGGNASREGKAGCSSARPKSSAANSSGRKDAFRGAGNSARKPPRAVWSGFISKADQLSKKGSSNGQAGKAGKKGHPRARARQRSESSEDEDDGEFDSEYEEEVEASPEFQAMVVSFFNDASPEELTTIDGCSRSKANKIISIRPFDDFAELQEKLDEAQGLGSHLLWNCEAVFGERRAMEELMERCTAISSRIQERVTAVIQAATASSDDDNAEGAGAEGQVTRQPSLLNRSFELKPYQLVGLNWLKLMHAQEVNGILADEMGLGKTIQVIALLAQLLEEGLEGPHLVVAPSSTVDNWLRELHTWCPALEAVRYQGSVDERAELREELLYGGMPFNVIVTSYQLCTGGPADRGMFCKLPFEYAIFDEGHMLKNMKSQRFNHLMKIKAKRRLLLTGTPLQNNLQELISVLTFTLPALFGGKAQKLSRVFSMTKQKGDNPHQQSNYEMERIAHARQIMQPFVLRRIKKDVLRQLPAKFEVVEHVEMVEGQSLGYSGLLATISQDFRQGGPQAGRASSAMMELRKQANHPLLIRHHYDDARLRTMAALMLKEPSHCDANEQYVFEDMQVMSDFELHKLCHEYALLSEFRLDRSLVAESGKLRYLDGKLKELKERGDRVLLFSQFVIVLDIVEEYLRIRGYKFLRMDGQTHVTDRVQLMDRFNADDSVFIFLLSTRAGGVGINLTAANTVILHDIDFNPYNDKQAEDRCHRVGQTRDVTVVRLVSKHTIEEGMLSCANYKLKLEQQMTGGGTGEEGKEDVQDIESLLRDALDI